jgi:hypothetical protein
VRTDRHVGLLPPRLEDEDEPEWPLPPSFLLMLWIAGLERR